MQGFSQWGDKLLASITAICALAATQAAALHISATVVAWITFGSGIATLLHTILFPNTPAESAVPQSKQGGWARLGFLATLLVLVVVCLSACASLSFDEELASAYTAHTAVVNAATQAVTAGTLSSAQGQQVLTMAQTSRTLLDAAKAAETTGNATGASSELQLASSALSALQTFVNSQVKK